MTNESIEADDLEECALLFKNVFSTAPWNEAWGIDAARKRLTDIFNTPGFLGLKALDGHQLVAFLMGYTEPYHNRTDFYLKEMCVDPTRQREGVGAGLLEHFCDLAARRGISQVYLLTAKGSSAESFYAKHGFRMSDRVGMMTHRIKEKT